MNIVQVFDMCLSTFSFLIWKPKWCPRSCQFTTCPIEHQQRCCSSSLVNAPSCLQCSYGVGWTLLVLLPSARVNCFVCLRWVLIHTWLKPALTNYIQENNASPPNWSLKLSNTGGSNGSPKSMSMWWIVMAWDWTRSFWQLCVVCNIPSYAPPHDLEIWYGVDVYILLLL